MAEFPRSKKESTLRMYVSGFVLSIVFTLIAYILVEIHVNSAHETFTHPFLITVVAILAIAQFFVQLYFFLHLGQETRPRWKLLVLSFMVLVVLILVFGSIWIMYNLNYRMKPQNPQNINNYLKTQSQDGL